MPNNCHLTKVPEIEPLTSKEINILLKFQNLWIEIVHWVRSYYHTVFGNLPEQRSIGARLFVELPMDLNNEFKKYFTEEEAQKFGDISSRFITINWQLVNSYKSEDKISIDLSTAEYYRIADEFAAFLASVNEYYDEAHLKELFYDHVRLKIAEINTLLSGDYDLEMKVFGELADTAAYIGIYMALGIIAKRRDHSLNTMRNRCLYHR
ncbi:MAG: hypothetical protein AAGU75_15470 [Bacillota bacterium]